MPVVVDDDAELLERLRAGDEDAFMTLVDRYGPLMLRIALTHVPTSAVAEEVVQEAWLGVLQGLDRFEGRSSLKTWILRIVANRARTRGERERAACRCPRSTDGDEPAVDPDRFLPPDHPRYPGGWGIPPHTGAEPEERLLAAETLQQVRTAIAELPPRQQEVIVLRDVEGWEPEEVSAALELTAGNQRVLLHRARAKVRDELEGYLHGVRHDRRCDHPRRHQLPRAWWSSSPTTSTARYPADHGPDERAPERCDPCTTYVEQIRMTARLAAVATAELQLRPDRDELLHAFSDFQRRRATDS